jgi:UDP-3-O-[3-hydroxymyristoyl] glucosamine N-acyltransferase
VSGRSRWYRDNDEDGFGSDDHYINSCNPLDGYVDRGGDPSVVCQATCLPSSTPSIAVSGTATTPTNFSLDLGGKITGQVSSGSTELPGVTVEAYNTGGDLISQTVTDSLGNYLLQGLVDGSLFLRTRHAAPYRNQLYDADLCDAYCDVTSGDPVGVSLGITTPGIHFDLAQGFSISGVVNDGVDGIGGVEVEAFDSTGLPAGSAMSSPGSGAYRIEGLAAGDYRLRTSNNNDYIDVVLGGASCTPYPCTLEGATVQSISTTDLTGVDISLLEGNILPGVATAITDTVPVPLPTGEAWLFSDTAELVKTVEVVDGLFTFRGVADGSYYLLIRNDLGLVDQLWAGVDCPGGGCDIVLLGTPITVGPAPAAAESGFSVESAETDSHKISALEPGETRFEFNLPLGEKVRGSVLTESGEPVQYVWVYLFDGAGGPSARGMTNALGEFETEGGLFEGSWYAATQYAGVEGLGNGLVDEVYQDISCEGDCDPTDPAARPVVIDAFGADDVHIVVGNGNALSGSVVSESTAAPIAQVLIELHDASGLLVGSTSTDGLGAYSFDGLLAGDYRVLAKPQAGSYGAELYDDIYCDGGCDILSGSLVTVGGALADNIDFALPDDNCPNLDNPDQLDSDGDGRGDACEGEPPVIDPKSEVDPTAVIGDGTEIAKGARVMANVTIGSNALVDRNVEVGENCFIGDDVYLGINSVLGSDCWIGDGSYLDREVTIGVGVTIGSVTIIGKNVEIGDAAVIGTDVKIGKNTVIAAGICIPDGAEIPRNSTITEDQCTP